MVKRFFSPNGLWQNEGLGLIRILVGLFMIYHGKEIFQQATMKEYSKWLTDLHFPLPAFMAYLGKGVELVSGICLTIGLLTRLATIPLMITMTIICFGMGHGKIFSDDQHPFLFVLLGLVFFFYGPGKWNFDEVLFSSRKVQ